MRAAQQLEEANANVVEEDSEEFERAKLCCSARLCLTIMSFFALFNLGFIRIGLSMILVCMTFPDENFPDKEDVPWSSATRGYVISAAFYGFLIGPFLAGILSFKLGGKLTLLISTFASSLLHFILPQCIRTTILFSAIRVLVGIFGGFVLPSVYDLFDKWIVPQERQRLVAGALVAFPLVSILNFPINGFICGYLGWIWHFYSFAIWLMIFGVFCIFLIYDTPEECPLISEAEVLFIRALIPKPVKKKIPWVDIFKSLPIYAYIVMHFCVNYVYLTMIFSLPVLIHMYNYSLRENGILSSIPFITQLIMRIFLTVFFEKIRKKLKLSKNIFRKILVGVGALVTSLSLLLVILISDRYLVLIFFALASVGLEFSLTGGYLMSLLDLCPGYVNILTGVTNAIANSAGLVCAVLNGLLTTHETLQDWYKVFYVNISILIAAMIFYLVFGKNDVQYWALGAELMDKPISKQSFLN